MSNILGGSSQNVTDIESNSSISGLYGSLTTNIILGSICLVTFLVLRTFQTQYWLKELLPYVTVKPPKLPHTFPANIFGWLKPCFLATDDDLLRSVGLDALVLQKTMTLGIQLTFPLTVLGLAVLLPLHLGGSAVVGEQTFAELTMANVTPGSPVLWVHWVTVLVFLLWAILLMDWHYRQFVSVRQHYIKGGDDPNYWRDLHMAEADGVLVHKNIKLMDLLAEIKYKKLMDALDEQENERLKRMHWGKKVMLWLTRWLETTDPAEAARHRTPTPTSPGEWHNIAANVIQGEYIRDVAHPQHEAPKAVPIHRPEGDDGDDAPPAAVAHSDVHMDIPPSGGSTTANGKAANGSAGSPLPLHAGAGGADAAGPAADQSRQPSINGALPKSKSKEALVRAIVGEDIGSKVAPKWWSKVDAVATEGGLRRRVQKSELENTAASVIMLAKPSVRFRKTINTYNHVGKRVAVNAQQYAVLVTNVRQVCYPEQAKHRPGGHSKQQQQQQQQDGAAVDPVLAAEEGKSASVACGSSSSGGGGAPRGWAAVRKAVADGRVRALLSNPDYSMVSAVFSSLFPNDFDQVVPVFKHKSVDVLMRRWDMRLGQLEAALHRERCTGVRPRMRVGGCCGFGGQVVDAIEWLQQEIEALEPRILAERQRVMSSEFTPSWFVLFRTQKAAAIATSCTIHPLNQETFQVHPCPGPEEVNWQALWYNATQRSIRAIVVAPFIVLLVLVPVSLLSSGIAQLNTALCSNSSMPRWGWYCDNDSRLAAILKALITGFLPSLLVLLWQSMALPRLVFLCAQSEGRHYSLSALDRRMAEIYFYWDVFSMFAQGVVGGTIILKIQDYINDPTGIPMLLGEAVPVSAKFFVIYLVMRALLTVPLRFLITQPGVWQSWLRVFDAFSRNPSERTWFMRHTIVSPRYGVEYGNVTLILLIALSLSIVCPIVLPFACIFFAGMWLFWRYQLLYNYARKYESGGMMWPYLMNRVLICLEIMVLFTGCVLIVKRAFAQATLLWLLGSGIVLATYVRWQARYAKGTMAMPLLLAKSAPPARVPPSIYVPPPLLDNGMGWYPEWNKVWDFFGMPAYSF